jgi:hypothetical protein
MKRLATKLREIAAQITQGSGMHKEATSYLWEYRIGNFVFYTTDRKPAGFIKPAGFSSFTSRYYRLAGDIVGTDITEYMKTPKDVL